MSQPPQFSLHRGIFLGFYHYSYIIYQLTELKTIVKIYKKQLLLVRGNKLFLCLLFEFNESKHILLDSLAQNWQLQTKKTKVITLN